MRILRIILFLAVTINAGAQDNWKIAKQQDGITIYVQKEVSSNYWSFKAVMEVNSSIEKIVQVLKKVENYIDWFAFTASAHLIKTAGNSQYVCIETDYPWPYENEYMNYLMKFERISESHLTIQIQSLSGSFFTIKGIKPMKTAGGYIDLTLNNGIIKLIYYFHSEPRQKIPTWLINPGIHEMPYRTFFALRNKVKD